MLVEKVCWVRFSRNLVQRKPVAMGPFGRFGEGEANFETRVPENGSFFLILGLLFGSKKHESLKMQKIK